MKKSLVIFIVAMMLSVFTVAAAFADDVCVSDPTTKCLGCHKDMNPGIVEPWEDSSHYPAVGCYECHQADPGDKDAFEHNGATIAIIVSPKDCGRCHETETAQMTQSHHAKANKFSGSLDNVLGRVVTGEANFDLGCAGCHGSDVIVGENGHLVAGPWPNTGIGRLNPDGTNGACSACHIRHSFKIGQVRDPLTCGKCHQGPDHPQIEIYELSKHGIAYEHSEAKESSEKSKWILGEDYFDAPNCVTCHMGATRQISTTHDVGTRLYWTLRPIVSKPINAQADANRSRMEKVCSECHQENWYKGFFTQFDRYVELYNDKFAKPSSEIMKFLSENGVTDSTPFNEQVEIDFWHLWHHEGRRGRHGAAMMGSDWSHWNGMYEVALNFYFDLIPHADEAVAAKGNRKVEKAWEEMKKEILSRQEHLWKSGLSKEDREKIVDYYQKRYGKK